jgi:tetratricopeptide (TPR) repeat protein
MPGLRQMRRPREMCLLLLAVAFSAVAVSGQAGLGKGRLSGIVKTVEGQPIAGATVVFRFLESERLMGRGAAAKAKGQESVTRGTTTNQKGIWSYAGLATGTWEIMASARGYHSASRLCDVRQLERNPKVELRLERIEGGTDRIAPGLLEQADELAYRKRYGEAIALYSQYLEKDPEAVMVMLALADCVMEGGDIEEAIKDFQSVVDKTSTNPADKQINAQAVARIGECYFKRGDHQNAIKHWQRSVEVSPTDEQVAYNLAEVLFAEREADEAARYYGLAAKISPRWGDPHYKLGLIYLNKQDYQKARECFKKLIEIEPSSPLAKKAKEILKDLDRSGDLTAFLAREGAAAEFVRVVDPGNRVNVTRIRPAEFSVPGSFRRVGGR